MLLSFPNILAWTAWEDITAFTHCVSFKSCYVLPNQLVQAVRLLTTLAEAFHGILQPLRANRVGIAQSVLRWATRCTTGIRFPAKARFFFSPQRSNRLWGPPGLCIGYRGLLPRGLSGRVVKLTIDLLAPRSKMMELYVHSMSSWRSA
jgi:hypothetical protein